MDLCHGTRFNMNISSKDHRLMLDRLYILMLDRIHPELEVEEVLVYLMNQHLITVFSALILLFELLAHELNIFLFQK